VVDPRAIYNCRMAEFHLHSPGLPPFFLGAASPLCRIGRTPDQDLVLEDASISRHHARLVWRGGEVFLEDLGSRHGSFINGVRVASPAPVKPGDELKLGPLVLGLEELPDPAASEATVALALPLEGLHIWRQGEGSSWREAVKIVHEVSLLMLKEVSTEALLENLLERLYCFLKADRGAVLMKDKAGTLVSLGLRTSQTGKTGPLSLSSSTVEAALYRREALLLEEPLPPGRGSGTGLTHSIMSVPLEHEGEVLGLLYFDSNESLGPFSEEDLRFVAALSNLVAAKILHQRTAEELRKKQALEREMLQLDETTRAKSAFLTRISHEIRTPMNAVLGFARLALEHPLPAPAKDYVEKINSSGRWLVSLLNDFLDYSKIDAERLQLEHVPFSIAEVLAAVEDLFTEQAVSKGISLRGQVKHEVPCLLGDPLRLGQVLTNLVGNAVKFTEQGEVCVTLEGAETPEGKFRLGCSVTDTGIGLSMEQQALLFEPFTQADPSISRRFGGSGLGLSIARNLLALMGGTLHFQSELGRGSSFSFTVELELAPGDDPSRPVPWPAKDPVPLQGARILVVDDNRLNQEVAVASLLRLGVQPVVASDGLEGVRLAATEAFDAVLMDVEMPGLDGLEATARIRSLPHLGTLPIIAMTAHASQESRQRCLSAGMSDYLAKPIDPDHLRQVLGGWLQDKVPVGAPPAVSEGDLERFACLVPVMDVPRALARMEGNQDLLLKVMKAFLEESAHGGTLRMAMAAGDREGAYRQAHNCKGIARTLALPAVAAAAKDLETHLSTEDCDGWEAQCDKLDVAIQNFRILAGAFLQLPTRHP